MNYKSYKNDMQIKSIRYDFGKLLAKKENIINNDVIICGSPNTGIPSGKGFANSLGIKYEQFIVKKTRDRSFILPSDSCRKLSNESNLFINEEIVKNKDICIVDDSLVRGNTIKVLIKKLKNIGVNDVHIRISSPKVISECYYGIDIPTKNELIGCNKTEKEIAEIIGAKSLRYLNVEDIENYFNRPLCTGCFTGKYIEW